MVGLPRALVLSSLASLALAVAGTPGCAGPSAPITELVLVIHADLSVPDLHVTVTGPDGATRVDEHVFGPRFPLSVVMTRDAAPYGPVTIHLAGADVTVDAITDLVEGQRRRLNLTLSPACLCVHCTSAQTCRAGTCGDRHLASTTLTPWVEGSDAALAEQRDAAPRDAGIADGGMCGCMGQRCCAGSCNGTFSCRMDVCRDCEASDPTVTGMTPMGAVVTAISAGDATLWVSSTDGTAITQMPFALGGRLTGTGTAPVPQLLGMTTSGSALTVLGTGGSMGTLRFTGATLSGAFSAPPRPDGSDGTIVQVVGSGHTLTLRAWDGSSGTITFASVETCL